MTATGMARGGKTAPSTINDSLADMITVATQTELSLVSLVRVYTVL